MYIHINVYHFSVKQSVIRRRRKKMDSQHITDQLAYVFTDHILLANWNSDLSRRIREKIPCKLLCV